MSFDIIFWQIGQLLVGYGTNIGQLLVDHGNQVGQLLIGPSIWRRHEGRLPIPGSASNV